uniref:Proenkephalin-A-like n=1 Tax=Salmo trutta TaxID=8032 RepID=A0A674EC98_SALTR
MLCVPYKQLNFSLICPQNILPVALWNIQVLFCELQTCIRYGFVTADPPLCFEVPLPFLSLQTCSIECEGSLDTTKLRLYDVKQEEVQGQQHQLAKKYGGFMKRYGGFMIRRRSPVEVGRVQGGENSPVAEEEDIRLEILKILNAEAEDQRDGEMAKRYGGFMRRGGDLGGLEGVGRPLKKRYGGFMRRVGRPEWLEDQKNQGGLLKRSWEGERGDSPLVPYSKYCYTSVL